MTWQVIITAESVGKLVSNPCSELIHDSARFLTEAPHLEAIADSSY